MKGALIVAVVLTSAAPSWAAGNIKKFSKVLVCGLDKGGYAVVGAGEADGPGTARVSLDPAYALIRDELAAQLQGAGVSLVPFDEADSAVKKQRAAAVGGGRAKVAPAAAATGKAGGQAADDARNAAMMNALKDPRLTPEMRAQIQKSMSASPSSGGMMQDMMASKMSGMIDQGESLGAIRNDSADGLSGMCPPWNAEEVVKDRETARFFELLESLGADAWLNLRADLRGDEGVELKSVSRKVYSSSKHWVYEARLFNSDGKRVWKSKKPVDGEPFKVGKTAGEAAKAISAAVPDSVSKLVEKLTD